jgi:DNA-binding transcriptional LysR family regulator
VARRVGLSQSAASHALARLRRALGDPLFVRAPGGLIPTARAEALAEPLRAALESLGRSLARPEPFDPARSRRSFSLASADYGAYVVLPPLMERIAREAPGVDIWVRPMDDQPFEQLARGDVDTVIAPLTGDAPAALHARKLFDERFVGIARRGHPRVRGGVALDAWTELPHIFIAPRGRPGGVVDAALARVGRARRVSLAVPQFLIAPHVVTRTDLVGVLGARLAESLAQTLPLQLFDPPVTLPTFPMHLLWHARTHEDPGQRWFRAQVVDAAAADRGGGRVAPR